MLTLVYKCVNVVSHRQMVSASQDGKLLVWDTHTGNKVRTNTKEKKTLITIALT